MMPAAQWDREFIADFATERARLRECEVVGIRRLAAAEQARLLGDVTQMLPIAIAARGCEREDALVDALRLDQASELSAWRRLRLRDLSTGIAYCRSSL